MDRDIRTPAVGAAGGDYLQKLYKLIPAELTAAYLALSSLLVQTQPTTDAGQSGFASNDVWLFSAFLVLFVALPFYLYFVQGVRTWLQIIATVVSFPIWAANVSAPLLLQYFGVPPVGLGALLILWTTLLPLFVR